MAIPTPRIGGANFAALPGRLDPHLLARQAEKWRIEQQNKTYLEARFGEVVVKTTNAINSHASAHGITLQPNSKQMLKTGAYVNGSPANICSLKEQETIAWYSSSVNYSLL